MEKFTIQDIESAYKRISGYVHKTPVISSAGINELFGCKILFKCENFQKVGAFKFRGAMNTILTVDPAQLSNGVLTHSSGNHAQALSLAAKIAGVPAYLVMPSNSSRVKVAAVQSYGGKIIFCEPNQAAREDTAKQVMDETGALFIHPYDKAEIILGQASACYEFLKDLESPDIIMAPIGGGGLLSGTALSAKLCGKNVKVFGAEPKNADDAYKTFHTGKFTPSVNPITIADGLLTSLGQINRKVICDYVDDILLCSENSIIAAMMLIFERLKIVVEPSAAVPLACIIDNPEKFANKYICIIVSGGNIDMNRFFDLWTK
jgi:threonine dehydratase